MVQEVKARCELCQDLFTRRGMTSHLKTCISRQLGLDKGETGTLPGPYFHIAVFGAPQQEYWQHILLRADAAFNELDAHLLETWFETPGTLRAFRIGIEDIDPNTPAGARLSDGLRFQYEYDFNEPTLLSMQVIGCYSPVPNSDGPDSLRSLARNEAPLDNNGKPVSPNTPRKS